MNDLRTLKCLVPGAPKSVSRSEMLTNDLRATVDKFRAAQQAYWNACASWEKSYQAGEAPALQDTKASDMQRTKDDLFEVMSSLCNLTALQLETEVSE